MSAAARQCPERRRAHGLRRRLLRDDPQRGVQRGRYSYASWFYNALNFANISKYNIWIAQYRDTLSFSYKHNIWQYTGSGSVKGISKPVDMNIG